MAGYGLAIFVSPGLVVVAGIEERGEDGVDVATVAEGHVAATLADLDAKAIVDGDAPGGEGRERVAAEAAHTFVGMQGALLTRELIAADGYEPRLVAEDGDVAEGMHLVSIDELSVFRGTEGETALQRGVVLDEDAADGPFATADDDTVLAGHDGVGAAALHLVETDQIAGVMGFIGHDEVRLAVGGYVAGKALEAVAPAEATEGLRRQRAHDVLIRQHAGFAMATGKATPRRGAQPRRGP